MNSPRNTPLSVDKKITVGPLFLQRKSHLTLYEPNRGLSGTQYPVIQLALYLRQRIPDAEVIFASVGEKLLPDIHGMNQSLANINDFEQHSGTIICPVESLVEMSPSQLSGSKVVVISEHPYDAALKRVRKLHSISLELHCSKFSFWSNFHPFRAMGFLPNLFWLNPTPPGRSAKKFNSSKLRVGFVGSLVPAKGFLLLAQQWAEIRSEFPTLTLEVAGGASLHGEDETHETIPAEKEYGDKVLRALGGVDQTERLNVHFLGRVDAPLSSASEHWDFAICNPTGHTESFCASVRECMALGIPVIAGGGEGLSERMAMFPELRLNRVSDLPRVIRDLIASSPEQKRQLEEKMARQTNLDRADLRRSLEIFLKILLKDPGLKSSTNRLRIIKTWPCLPARSWVELLRGATSPYRSKVRKGLDFLYLGLQRIRVQPFV